MSAYFLFNVAISRQNAIKTALKGIKSKIINVYVDDLTEIK